MQYAISHEEVLERFPLGSWQHCAASNAIAQIMTSDGRDYPCVFAIQAVAQHGFYYLFAENSMPDNLADGLREFLRCSRTIGPYASMSYVFPPEEVQSLEIYHHRFWEILKTLHANDEKPWPTEIPTTLKHPEWTFCFDGEALFPLCMTPAHRRKRTRFATNFTISFQPRWTFKHHLPDAPTMSKYSLLIQKRVEKYDSSPISPNLGLYGKGYLDANKYFFHDDNHEMPFPENLEAQVPENIAGSR